MANTTAVAEALNSDETMQIVFTKGRNKMNGVWALNRIVTNGEFRGWELVRIGSFRQEYALMSTDKAARVAAKHLAGLVPNVYTREDFNA